MLSVCLYLGVHVFKVFFYGHEKKLNSIECATHFQFLAQSSDSISSLKTWISLTVTWFHSLRWECEVVKSPMMPSSIQAITSGFPFSRVPQCTVNSWVPWLSTVVLGIRCSPIFDYLLTITFVECKMHVCEGATLAESTCVCSLM